MKRIAIILSGCGVYDGSEIHESVLTMLAVSKMGLTYQLFAPDIEQMHVINHLNGEIINQKRNVLVESARIARGNIKPLSEYDASLFDALIIPGGYGMAKNLSSFAIDGIELKINKEFEKVVKDTHKASKPIGALCISPVIIAKIINNSKVTIGNDKATADVISKLGANHIETDNTGVAIDKDNKIVTTPCYMLDSNIFEVSQAAENLVKAIIELF